MAKPIEVKIVTDDGVVRFWRGEAAVQWAKYMQSVHGGERIPAPSTAQNPNNDPIRHRRSANQTAKRDRWIALARGALAGAAASVEHAEKLLGMLAYESGYFPCVMDERLAAAYKHDQQKGQKP